jgi:hypothetical protein
MTQIYFNRMPQCSGQFPFSSKIPAIKDESLLGFPPFFKANSGIVPYNDT